VDETVRQTELHELVMKIRRNLREPGLLTSAERAQIERRIAELGGRGGWLRFKELTK